MRPSIPIILPHKEGFGPGRAGAVSMVVRRIAAASRSPVLVIGPDTPGPRFTGIDFRAVPVRRFPSQVWSYALGVAALLARLPPGPIELHNKPELALFLSYLFPARPITLFLHNDPRAMRTARSPAQRRRLLARMAHVVCVSAHLRAALLDGIDHPPADPLVIANAIDPAELPALTPPEARAKLILFAGRVVPQKAPDAFVAACARALPALPGWRAAIIGGDGFTAHGRETGFIAALRPRAAAAGVELRGYLPHDQVLAALAEAAIAVVPSRWEEPFGLAALEAMACGAALACSMRGGLAEVAGDAALIFDPDDIDEAAATLVRLAGDATLRARLAEAGRARVAAHFSLPAMIDRLEALRAG